MPYLHPTDLPTLTPILPLEGHVLLPASACPHRVTGLAQRLLIEDLLTKPAHERWVVVPTGDHDTPIATLALVTIATPTGDGDYIIVVEGQRVCQLVSTDATPPHAKTRYPLATLQPLQDRPHADDALSTTELIQATMALAEYFAISITELAVCTAPSEDQDIVYQIASAIIDDPQTRIALLKERHPAKRRARVFQEILDQLAFAQRSGLLSDRPAFS